MENNYSKYNKIPKYRQKHPYYENRELSWLKFNERILDEARNVKVPLCERMSFASIFQKNLDEFYMIRVGSFYDQLVYSKNKKDKKDNKTNMTVKQQLHHIFKETRRLTEKKDKTYNRIIEELTEHHIEIADINKIKYEDMIYLQKYFQDSILPVLSPQVVGKKQSFPFLNNEEIYAVAAIYSGKREKIAFVPCSNGILKRLIPVLSDSNRYVLVEDLILHFMSKIFNNYQIKSSSLIRIIRNADIDVDEALDNEDADYRKSMEKLIKKRKMLQPVKLECYKASDEWIIHLLQEKLMLKKRQIFYSQSPLEFSFIFEIRDKLRGNKELFYNRHIPKIARDFAPATSIMSQIEKADRLLCYPYESMTPFIKLLSEAGEDDNVIYIKMTLYRVAKNSQIVETLINAAENGKEVVVLVELRARFDEENNIGWSRVLEEAGCRVIYGLDHTKVHSKMCVITYQGKNKVRYITQIGTGNYNEKTAKLYTDLSLMTADRNIGIEAATTFSKLCMGEFIHDTKHLLVAPRSMKDKILEYMNQEIEAVHQGMAGFIGIKINSLTDKEIIDKLIECSKEGVQIQLIVRGICCLVPDIKGYTENISVISIVGRFLEHSRIYIFGTAQRDHIFIASADFMTRNMERRVEIAAPIYDEGLKERVRNIFHIMQCDTVKAKQLTKSGKYKRRDTKMLKVMDSQEYLCKN